MHQKAFDEFIEKNRRTVSGHSVEFQINHKQSQIQIDIPVNEFTTVRVWGQIKNKHDQPVEGIMLQLVRVERMKSHGVKYHGLAHTISDCHGFYQFDLCANSLDTCYQIFANKSAIGPQWYIPSEQEYRGMDQEWKSEVRAT